MLEILTSVLGGGLTGLLGAGVQRFFDYKSEKLKIQASREQFAHEVAMKRADAEIMAQEWAARTKVAEIEGAAKVEVEDAKAFSEALTSEPKLFSERVRELSPLQSWLMVILDFTRGIIRPGLTLYLSALSTAIYIKASRLMGADLPTDQAYALVDQIVQTILYLWTTATLFWFGTRASKKK